MTKADVKLLCKHSEHLTYMVTVLFAELYEVAEKNSGCRLEDAFIAQQCRTKADEFEWHVIQEQLKQAKEKEAATVEAT